MTTRAYHRPRTLDEALALKREAGPDARFIAGGTDLLVGSDQPETLVSLRSIDGLSGIEAGDPTRIGALTLVEDLLDDEQVATHYPAVAQACRVFASMQIRNAATVGGNLCNASPAADLAPPFLVHGARVGIQGADGSREVALEEFFVGPGQTMLADDEVLTHVLLDAPAAGTRALFSRKTRVRMDIALVSVAVLLESDGGICSKARVAAGAVAPTPRRLFEVEQLLEGERITPELMDRAAELGKNGISPVDDIRTTAAYRRRITGVYLRRALEELCA
jgi:carbon-monoxide dehydrogenase medium subunit